MLIENLQDVLSNNQQDIDFSKSLIIFTGDNPDNINKLMMYLALYERVLVIDNPTHPYELHSVINEVNKGNKVLMSLYNNDIYRLLKVYTELFYIKDRMLDIPFTPKDVKELDELVNRFLCHHSPRMKEWINVKDIFFNSWNIPLPGLDIDVNNILLDDEVVDSYLLTSNNKLIKYQDLYIRYLSEMEDGINKISSCCRDFIDEIERDTW